MTAPGNNTAQLAALRERGTAAMAASASGGAAAPAAPRLMEGASQAAAANTKRRRQVGRRNTDEATDRAIAEHFGKATPIQVDHHRVGGRTLREQITHDKRTAKCTGGRLGTAYWQKLKQTHDFTNGGGAS